MKENNNSWFNPEEFSAFLTEGQRMQKAYVNNLKTFARVNMDIRRMLQNTPLKHMARAQVKKSQMKARAMKRAARRYEEAESLEQEEKKMRYGVRQEDINFDDAFDNFLSEANKGSQKDTVVNPKESAGQRAAERNPTGNEKNQARLKKEEQRKDEGRSRSSSPNSKAGSRHKKTRGVIVKGAQGNPGNFIGVRIKKGAEKGVVEIIPKGDFKEGIHEVLAGSSDDDGKKATLEELRKLASEDNFQRTKSSDYLKITRPDDKKKDNKPKADEKRRKPKSKGKRKTPSSPSRKKSSSSDANKQDDSEEQEMPLRMAITPKNGALIAFQSTGSSGVDIPAGLAESSGFIAQLAEEDPDLNDPLREILNSYDIDRYSEAATNFPELKEIGIQQKIAIIQSAIEHNEEVAKLAENMDPSEYSKQFGLLPTSKLRSCMGNSDFYRQFGAKDKTPKADLILVPRKIWKSVVKKVKSDKCKFEDSELQSMYSVSVKKGADAQLASGQEAESTALLESVSQRMQQFMNDPQTAEIFEKLLKSGSGENADYMVEMKKAIEVLKSIIAIKNAQSPSFLGKWTYTQVKDPIERQRLASFNPTAANALTQIEAKNKELEDIMDKILDVDIIKVLLIHEAMSGEMKFQADKKKNDFSPLGRASALMLMNDQGNPTGMLQIIDPTLLLEGRNSEKEAVRRFYIAAREFEFDASFKSRYAKKQDMSTLRSVVRIRGKSQPKDVKEEISLDYIFETQYEPYDRDMSLVTNSPEMEDPAVPATNDELDDEFVPFGGMAPEEFAEEVNYDIFRFLEGAGIMIKNFEIKPFDAGELGLRISSMDNSIKNYMSYNGKEYIIPVLSGKMMESIMNEYNTINDKYVKMVEEGMNPDEAVDQMKSDLLEVVLFEKKRNYAREYKLFHSKPEQRKKRSNRVLARRKMVKKYGKNKLKGKDIDHKDGNALNNGDSNLRVRSINNNRSDNGHSKKTLKEGNWKNRLEGSWEYTQFLLKKIPGQTIDNTLKKILSKNKGKSR